MNTPKSTDGLNLLRNPPDFSVVLGGPLFQLLRRRTPDMILYPRELERWRSRFDFQAEVTVDSGTGAWRGNVGVVTTLINKAMVNPDFTVAMVCGPEVMMYHTVMELRKNGVLPSRIYLSMERNMKCAIGFCGHCQFGGSFVCKDGPVFRYDRISGIFGKREI